MYDDADDGDECKRIALSNHNITFVCDAHAFVLVHRWYGSIKFYVVGIKRQRLEP